MLKETPNLTGDRGDPLFDDIVGRVETIDLGAASLHLSRRPQTIDQGRDDVVVDALSIGRRVSGLGAVIVDPPDLIGRLAKVPGNILDHPLGRDDTLRPP